MSDQTYSLGAWFGKDPEEVKKEKSEGIDKQIDEVGKCFSLLVVTPMLHVTLCKTKSILNRTIVV